MTLYEQIENVNKTISKSEFEKRGLFPQIKEKLRFETIIDNTGTWIRDNSTGIEYSKKIGLHLIDH